VPVISNQLPVHHVAAAPEGIGAGVLWRNADQRAGVFQVGLDTERIEDDSPQAVVAFLQGNPYRIRLRKDSSSRQVLRPIGPFTEVLF